MSIRTRHGRSMSPRQYLALHNAQLARRRPLEFNCEHGHHGCAAWRRGPCAYEVADGLEGPRCKRGCVR